MTFDHADLVAEERNGLLDPAAYARKASSQKLVFRHQRARELPPALHQRLDMLQLRVGKRLGKPGARRRVIEHPRQFRHHARMGPFPLERQVERARDERPGLMQVNDRHGQACRLQRECSNGQRERIGGTLQILFLTIRAHENEVFSAITAGTDGYMIKPINHFELLARIMPREALIRSLWGRDMAGAPRSLDTHIYRLRTKLALQPSNGVRLSAVYTLGYRIEAV